MRLNDKELLEIKHNNKLIAKFIGMQHTNKGWFDNEDNLAQFIYDQTGGNYHDVLHFNTSWDWLMPVVEKIEETPYCYEFQIGYKELCVLKNPYTEFEFKVEDLQSKLAAVYMGVIKFIEWYNKEVLNGKA